MKPDAKTLGGFDRDILEWNIPEEVLAVLLKDRSTGRNLIWATDDYAERGRGFGANHEMQIEQVELITNCDKPEGLLLKRVSDVKEAA